MPAGRKELVLHVEGAEGRVLHQQMLLEETQAAGVLAWGVRGGPGDEAPGQLVFPLEGLQVPHILA